MRDLKLTYSMLFLLFGLLEEVNGYLPGMKYNFYHTVNNKGRFWDRDFKNSSFQKAPNFLFAICVFALKATML